MNDDLKDILSKVNEWLRFAETKNAANIVYCSSLCLGIFNYMSGNNSPNGFLFYYFVLIESSLVFSSTISLSSFIPQLIPPWIKIEERTENDNPVFFGHACKYDPKSYLTLLNDNCDKKWNKLEVSFADQIIINSNITFKKFKLFDLAIKFTIGATVSPVFIALIIALIKIKTIFFNSI